MLFDIDQSKKPKTYKMRLMTPTLDPIGNVNPNNYCVLFKYSAFLDHSDKLQFSISKDVTNFGKTEPHPFWDDMRGDYLIYLTDGEDESIAETFIITDTKININDKHIKDVVAHSLDYEISYKQIRNYSSTDENGSVHTRKLYDILSELLAEHTDENWRIGYIDPDVNSRYRQYDVSESNLLDFFVELQQNFSCAFKYDTAITKDPITKVEKVNRVINIFDMTTFHLCPQCESQNIIYEESTLKCYNPTCADTINPDTGSPYGSSWIKQIYGNDSGLYINERYIKQFEVEDDNKKIVTRLFVEGGANSTGEKLSIREINETGQPYIENYAYYRNSTYMSDDLLDALDRYDSLVASKQTDYQNYLQQKKNLENQLTNLLDGVGESTIKNATTTFTNGAMSIQNFGINAPLADGVKQIKLVVTDGENPIEGANVDIVGKNSPQVTGVDGSYTFTLDKDGTYISVAGKQGYNPSLNRFAIGENNSYTINIVLHSVEVGNEKCAVYGRIVDSIVPMADPVPFSNAKINVMSGQYVTTTSNDGCYAIVDIIPGAFDMSAVKSINAGDNLLLYMDLVMSDGRYLYNKYLQTGDETYRKQAESKLKELDDEITAENLNNWGLNQLKEASNVYQKRIDALVEAENNVANKADIAPTITLTNYWTNGMQFTFSIPDPDDSATELTSSYTVSSNIDKVAIPDFVKKVGSTTRTIKYSYGTKLHLYIDNAVQAETYQYNITPQSSGASKYYVEKVKGGDLPLHKKQIDDAIIVRQSEVDAQTALIKQVNVNIMTLQQTLSKEKNFTKEQIKQLNYFIRVSTYKNDDITSTAATGSAEYLQDLKQLLRDGKSAFANLWYPPINFTIDIVDFTQVVECQRDWGKLNIGDIIHVRHKKADEKYYTIRLIGYTHDPLNKNLDLELSTADMFNNPARLQERDYTSIGTNSSILSSSKATWDNSKQGAVDQILSQAWDSAKAAVLAGSNQETVIDDKGITLSCSQPAKSGYELRLMSNLIAFTTNNWQTVNTAISSEGIFAQYIIGKLIMSENLQIMGIKQDGTGYAYTLDGNGVVIQNNSLTIKSANGAVGNGIFMTPEEGMKITNQDGTFMVELSATKGMVFNKWSGGRWVPVLNFDTLGNGFVDGDFTINKTLKIRGNDIENLIQTAVDGQKKISGEGLEGRGLTVYGNSESDIKMKIDPTTGLVSLYNNRMELNNSGGIIIRKGNTTITLDPSVGIKITNSGEEKFYIDTQGNVYICGTLMTGLDGQARIVIDDNGITSYKAGNVLNGLVVPKSSSNPYGELYLYINNNAHFAIKPFPAGDVQLHAKGASGSLQMFLNTTGIDTQANRPWNFSTNMPTYRDKALITEERVRQLIDEAVSP